MAAPPPPPPNRGGRKTVRRGGGGSLAAALFPLGDLSPDTKDRFGGGGLSSPPPSEEQAGSLRAGDAHEVGDALAELRVGLPQPPVLRHQLLPPAGRWISYGSGVRGGGSGIPPQGPGGGLPPGEVSEIGIHLEGSFNVNCLPPTGDLKKSKR